MVAQQYAKVLARQGYEVTVLTLAVGGLQGDEAFNDGQADRDDNSGNIRNRNRKQSGYQQQPASSEREPYSVVAVKAVPKLWFLAYRNAVDFSSYDLILLNDPAACYVAGRYFSDKVLKKCICFLHGSEPEFIFENPTFLMKISGYRRYYSRAVESCRTVVAVSSYMKRKFLDRVQLNITPDKIMVIHSGVDRELFFPEPDEDFRRKWSVPEKAVLLLSVSRINREKGYEEKYHIFKRLCGDQPDLYWLIVGDGNWLPALKKKVAADGLADRVLFAGKKPRSELRAFYSNADLYWLLSNYDESFGLGYVEAQACGLPVMGRNSGGVVEAIEPGASGFLVNSNEEAYQIVKEKSFLKLSKSTILRFAETFDVERSGSRLSGIFPK